MSFYFFIYSTNQPIYLVRKITWIIFSFFPNKP